MRDANVIVGSPGEEKSNDEEEDEEDRIPKRVSFDANAVKEFQDKLIFEISESILVNTRLKIVNEELTKELDSTQQNMVDQPSWRSQRTCRKDVQTAQGSSQ